MDAKFKKASEGFKNWFNVDITEIKPPKIVSTPDFNFEFVDNEMFRYKLFENSIDFSVNVDDRFFRSFGQSCQDMVIPFNLRIPDIVVFPKSHKEVEIVVASANELNLVIIPFAGKVLILTDGKLNL